MVQDSTDFDTVRVSHDGTDGIINTTGSTTLNLQLEGTTELRLLNSSAAGNTSGAEVSDHAANFHQVGYNTLPEFNFNASDTLEAQHNGKITGKDDTGTTYRLTGPTSSDEDFPVGGVCQVVNLGTATDYEIADTGGGTACTMYYLDPDAGSVTDIVGLGTLGPGGWITLWRRSTTAIYITGSGFTP